MKQVTVASQSPQSKLIASKTLIHIGIETNSDFRFIDLNLCTMKKVMTWDKHREMCCPQAINHFKIVTHDKSNSDLRPPDLPGSGRHHTGHATEGHHAVLVA